MLKKNILIPYEKYEKLMNHRSKDEVDGQCISHTQHNELNRDKHNEYGVKVEKDKVDPTKAKMSLGLQKGEGGIDFHATGEVNNDTSLQSTINEDTSKKIGYKSIRGPPGRRVDTKSRKRKWEQF